MSDELFNREEFVSYFRDEAEELLQQIDADLLKLEEFATSKESDPEIVNSLFRALHTIKGSGGMLGFTDVQGLAHKLENLCDLLRKDRMPLSESCVDILFSGRDFLTDLVGIGVGGEDAAAPGELPDYMESSRSVRRNVRRDGATSSKAAPVRRTRSTKRVGDSKPAADVEAFEAEIERLLEKPRHSAPRSGRRTHPSPRRLPPANPCPRSKRVAEAPEAAPATPAPAAAPAVPAVEIAAGAKEAKPEGKRASLHQTIRVDIERLDALLNLVGELVINRTRISDIANTLERLMGDKASNHGGASHGIIAPLAKDLADSAALLARTTNEIQESIMKVRMVPIGQVFDRFPRLVRDVAKARGKEVQLVISGAETDLDKTIVDEVGEPLMHLLRNCVDHGLELPEAREAKGKPRVGTIQLNAYHEGNQIIIEVSDDGGGIDLEKVRARGIKQGLISADDRLADRELIELIFTPGFSTAEVISDVSGRGVGMDVVKKNITRLKGIFDVDSVTGQGTRFTIKLPLTLAIIQALLVRVVRRTVRDSARFGHRIAARRDARRSQRAR